MFNRPSYRLQDLVDQLAHLSRTVHDHEMSGVFDDGGGRSILDEVHLVVIAVNMVDGRMHPGILPVQYLVNCPVDIDRVGILPVIFSHLDIQGFTDTEHPVLNGCGKFGGPQGQYLIQFQQGNGFHPPGQFFGRLDAGNNDDLLNRDEFCDLGTQDTPEGKPDQDGVFFHDRLTHPKRIFADRFLRKRLQPGYDLQLESRGYLQS